MPFDTMPWVELALRWLHVITGIAWIGASFYFVWLDNHLEKREGLPPGVARLVAAALTAPFGLWPLFLAFVVVTVALVPMPSGPGMRATNSPNAA